MAGPAFASDALELPPVPEPALPALPAPLAEPADAESDPAATTGDAQLSIGDAPATVTFTQTADGDLDVSVRVLSESDDAAAPEEAKATVISANPGADHASGAVQEHAPDAGSSDPGLESAPTSTKVSVRVLSPGDDDPIAESTNSDSPVPQAEAETEPAAANDGASPTPSTTDAGPAAEAASEAPRYQDANSQYQFDPISPSAPWMWEWDLSVDCLGNITSTSQESGSYTSSEWAWDWEWQWGCTDGAQEAPERDGEAGSASSRDPPEPTAAGADATKVDLVGSHTSSPSNDATIDQATAASTTSSGTWAWTWTFTFCGTTQTLSAELPAGAVLSWTWQWAWSWACSATADEPAPAPEQPAPAPMPVPAPTLPAIPAPGDAGPATAPAPTDPLPAAPGPLEVVSALPGFPEIALGPLGVTVSVELPGDITTSPLEIAPVAPQISVATAMLPVAPSPGEGAAATGAPRTAPPAPAVSRTEASPGEHLSTTPVFATPLSSTPAPAPTAAGRSAGRTRPAASPERERVREAPQARPAPPRSPGRPLLPSRLPTRLGAAGSSSVWGGTVPSGSVLLVAVLTGLFVLAAPGIGRRIRAMRELSPRSPSPSPIDHPG